MPDLIESVSLVHEALAPLDPGQRARVLASVNALLDDAPTEPRKPVPIPVQRVKPTSPKASGARPSKPSEGSGRPSPKLNSDRVAIMKIIDANPSCSLQDLRQKIPGRSLQCLKKALYSLIHDKEIVRTGSWTQARYSLAGQT